MNRRKFLLGTTAGAIVSTFPAIVKTTTLLKASAVENYIPRPDMVYFVSTPGNSCDIFCKMFVRENDAQPAITVIPWEQWYAPS